MTPSLIIGDDRKEESPSIIKMIWECYAHAAAADEVLYSQLLPVKERVTVNFSWLLIYLTISIKRQLAALNLAIVNWGSLPHAEDESIRR